MSEELMIEGNILLKHTDMDVRLGDPIHPWDYWGWLDTKLMSRFIPRLDTLKEAFELKPTKFAWDRRLLARRMRLNVLRVRDEYMHRIYSDVTVNLSHLISCLILTLLERGRFEIPREELHQILYLAIKKIQRAPDVHLHRSLRNPDTYTSLLQAEPLALAQFLTTASSSGLIEVTDTSYRFLPKLEEEHGFDEVRLENLVEVYTNEVAPLRDVRESLAEAIDESPTLAPDVMARFRLDDEAILLAWDRMKFSKDHQSAANRERRCESFSARARQSK